MNRLIKIALIPVATFILLFYDWEKIVEEKEREKDFKYIRKNRLEN